MNRWTILSGIAVAAYVLFQVQAGQITTEDVFEQMEIQEKLREEIAEVQEEMENGPIVEIEDEEKNGEGFWGKFLRPRDEQAELRVLAFGDMMLGRYVRTLMDRNGHDYPFVMMPKLDEMYLDEDGDGPDIIFGNLEGPIKGDGYKHPTAMVFGFPEYVTDVLADEGFDVLSIANNHALDQGWEGRDSTIAALEGASLGWCGHPTEGDLGSVYFGGEVERDDDEVAKSDFAIACFNTAIYRTDFDGMVELVKDLRPRVGILLVSIHWGNEYQHRASPNLQVARAHRLIDAGADFIIGHHPHVVQNFEIYNDRFIFYSLGNFIFDQYWAKNVQEELALGIAFAKDGDRLKTEVTLFPMKSEKSQPRLMTEEEKTEWLERFIKYGEYNETMKEMIRAQMLEVLL